MSPAPPRGLWLITDISRAGSGDPLPVLKAALAAGFSGLMVREKALPGRAVYDLARQAAALCREHGAGLVVNDRADLALALDGAGFHTGAAGLPVPTARKLLGPERRVGYSAHDPAEAVAALSDGADYVCLSPVFPSITKPDYRPRGEPWLRHALNTLPGDRVLALGGITPETLPRLPAGVAGALVMGAVWRAGDPGAVARDLVAAWNRR